MKPEVSQDVAKKRLVHLATLGRRAPRRPRFAPQLTPRMLEQSYAKQLLGLVAVMRQTTIDAIGPHLVAWVQESDQIHGRMDGASDDAHATFAGIRLTLERGRFSTAAVQPLARQQGTKTAAFQKKQLQRQLSVALGVQVPIKDTHLEAKVDAFTAQNVALIQSIPQQALQQVQQVLLQGLTGGDRAEDIAGQIQQRFDVSESRATLIATDQTLKFFSSLNQTRQRELGIEGFTWTTANDERERTCDECGPLDGKKFTWDDPPAAGLPGEIHPQCRCSADPDVAAVLDDLD